MIRTIASIFISLAMILGVSLYSIYYVNQSFKLFDETLRCLYDKTEAGTATYEDGTAVQTFWEEKKKSLQVWLPVGFIYVHDYKAALPKLDVVLGMCENIPHSYTFGVENIF